MGTQPLYSNLEDEEEGYHSDDLLSEMEGEEFA